MESLLRRHGKAKVLEWRVCLSTRIGNCGERWADVGLRFSVLKKILQCSILCAQFQTSVLPRNNKDVLFKNKDRMEPSFKNKIFRYFGDTSDA